MKCAVLVPRIFTRVQILNNPMSEDISKGPERFGRYKEDWARLLCPERTKLVDGPATEDLSDKVKPLDERSPFERDYERVVFSSGFRRLAGKTQVRTFPDVDFIHNRLTHSLEVSSVARSLGDIIAKFLVQRKDIEANRVEDICWISQAAGIAHDLGNPPYGHSGEYAIQHWARQLPKEMRIFQENEVWKDFENYDGNAQTFRILCSQETRAGNAFLFTAASAGAVIKYPKTALEITKYDRPPKFDVFSTEIDVYKKICKKLGFSKGKCRRHPLSYLSEAADDICYRVLDFEDAIISGVVTREIVVPIFRAGLGCSRDEREGGHVPMSKLRARLIRQQVVDFADCFKTHYEQIMAGELKGDLRENLPAGSKTKMFLDEIGELYDKLYTEHNKVIRECGAYSQIPLVLNRGYDFIREAFLAKTYSAEPLPPFADLSHYSQHFIVLAWGEGYYKEKREKSFEWWMHLLLDYVVGMTDAYINMLAQKLR